MKTAVIIQARYGSTRLPGKILEPMAGRSVLSHVLDRARSIKGIDVVVCAVPDSNDSDVIAKEASRCGAEVFRGSETDVLSRYLSAARMVSADIVMRITSDCPLIDPDVCASLLALRADTNSDYAANNMPPTFPHGLDCEAFTRVALEKADTVAVDAYDREHVTPWLRRSADLRRANLACDDPTNKDERWTLDYPEDLAFLRAIIESFPDTSRISTRDVLRLLAERPELRAINAGHRQLRQ